MQKRTGLQTDGKWMKAKIKLGKLPTNKYIRRNKRILTIFHVRNHNCGRCRWLGMTETQ